MWAPPAAHPVCLSRNDITAISCVVHWHSQYLPPFATLSHSVGTRTGFPPGHISPDIQYTSRSLFWRAKQRVMSLSPLTDDRTAHYNTNKGRHTGSQRWCFLWTPELNPSLLLSYMSSWKGVLTGEGLAQAVSQVWPLQQAAERRRPRWGQ